MFGEVFEGVFRGDDGEQALVLGVVLVGHEGDGVADHGALRELGEVLADQVDECMPHRVDVAQPVGLTSQLRQPGGLLFRSDGVEQEVLGAGERPPAAVIGALGVVAVAVPVDVGEEDETSGRMEVSGMGASLEVSCDRFAMVSGSGRCLWVGFGA
ncbi:hypothetical protein AB0O01_21055 [Streptomyces sp. NPDC093252]|uniref:hypothetical protein n=1 Tax=Streptomyces sp. NPDC093252 TaxID=3154980 RepID=UPI0034270958